MATVAQEIKESSLTQGITAVYIIVMVVNLTTVGADRPDVAFVSKALLMPLLAFWVVMICKHLQQPLTRPLRMMLIGIVFAWFGDIALSFDGDAWFGLGLCCFLVMQVLYILAYRAIPGPGMLRAWPLVWIPFALLWIAVNIVLFGKTGVMFIPVLVYSFTLVLMAAQALDLVLRVDRRYGWIVFIGALLFVVSDALIAFTAFNVFEASRATDIVIMATYAVAQAMIVVGLTYAVAYKTLNERPITNES